MLNEQKKRESDVRKKVRVKHTFKLQKRIIRPVYTLPAYFLPVLLINFPNNGHFLKKKETLIQKPKVNGLEDEATYTFDRSLKFEFSDGTPQQRIRAGSEI